MLHRPIGILEPGRILQNRAEKRLGNAVPTQSEISECCIDSLAEILRLPKDQIGLHEKFNRLGLDSAMSVYLVVALEEQLGVELAPEMIFEYPTVAALSDYLVQLLQTMPPGARRSRPSRTA